MKTYEEYFDQAQQIILKLHKKSIGKDIYYTVVSLESIIDALIKIDAANLCDKVAKYGD